MLREIIKSCILISSKTGVQLWNSLIYGLNSITPITIIGCKPARSPSGRFFR